tara:strand:+ start:4609 stop:4776 length:168 start_codon:yes stop_codon:yes gene_type:complete
MKLPKIDLKKLEEFKKKNARERLEFIDLYTEWLKKNNNKTWSSAQKKLINKESNI